MENVFGIFMGGWQSVPYFLLAILVLLVMITVHEFGHYLVGKLFKFKIDEFSIGFGPTLFKKEKKDGEKFSVRLLPLGGYCAFHGEDGEAMDAGDFNAHPPYQRILVLLAGAAMNFLTAILFVGILFGAYGAPLYRIAEVDELPSQVFMEGDVILSANGRNVYTVGDLDAVKAGLNAGDTVDFWVSRDGEDVRLTATLAEKNGALSFGIRMGGDWVRRPFSESVGRTFQYTVRLGGFVLDSLGSLLTGSVSVGEMGGTVTTLSVLATGTRDYGFAFLLQITALIGVNLAVFNLLPIPALDGAKVVFALIEWIFRKPVNRTVEAVIHFVGFTLLIGFAVFVDLQHCF